MAQCTGIDEIAGASVTFPRFWMCHGYQMTAGRFAPCRQGAYRYVKGGVTPGTTGITVTRLTEKKILLRQGSVKSRILEWQRMAGRARAMTIGVTLT